MITQTTMYNVKNRSSSTVVYRIPETGLRRERETSTALLVDNLKGLSIFDY